MTDGDENLSPAGSETTTDAGTETEALDTELDSTAEGEAAEGGEQEADELEDVEFGGKTYKLPKEIKTGVMMHADYTRKTQELAESRRGLDSDREAFTKEMEGRRQSEKDIGRIAVMDEQLAQYDGIDWTAARMQNPEGANAAFQDYTMLRDQRDKLATKVHADLTKRAEEAQQSIAKRYADTCAVMARDIKGWNQDTADKLRDFAIANGATRDDVIAIATNEHLQKLLHKAWMGDQILAKQSAAAAKAKAEAAPPPPEPLKQVAKGRSAPANGGLSDNLSAEEWVRRRNADIAARNAPARSGARR